MTSVNQLLHLPAPLVLASQSPRRRALLAQVGFEFISMNPAVDEDAVVPTKPYEGYVKHLAQLKAEAGLLTASSDVIVIGSDTTVVLDNHVLNKPADVAHACAMLSELSEKTHTVYTGLALAARVHGVVHHLVECSATDVTFRKLGKEEIETYVNGGSPMDKAGAYGIQDDFGAVFVKSITGCYYTVVGLPLQLLYTMLQQLVTKCETR